VSIALNTQFKLIVKYRRTILCSQCESIIGSVIKTFIAEWKASRMAKCAALIIYGITNDERT